MTFDRPIIGITASYDEALKSLWVLPGYVDAVSLAGGIPLLLPLNVDDAVIRQLLEQCDGLLFTGGPDVNPMLYGERKRPVCGSRGHLRDEFEVRLLQQAWQTELPVFGICRGLQLMNVVLGGTLYQDLKTEMPTKVEHVKKPGSRRLAHTLALVPETPLATVLNQEMIKVNSLHHQGIKKLAPTLRAMAYAPDGLIEGIFAPEKDFFCAVQYHPELNFRTNAESRTLFSDFVHHAEKHRQGK